MPGAGARGAVGYGAGAAAGRFFPRGWSGRLVWKVVWTAGLDGCNLRPVRFEAAFAYTGRVLTGLWNVVRFWWVASAGSRLRPWRSEYLRWRVETYTGKAAGTLRARDFARLLVEERGQMLRFARWLGELRRLAQGKGA